MNTYDSATEAQLKRVLRACRQYGSRTIIALSGVPGSGKSFLAHAAANLWASDPLCVLEVQFHPAYSYQEWVEGLRIGDGGRVFEHEGAVLEWNGIARDNPDQQYVILMEEFSRANIPAVFGELLTYIEHRDRPFRPLYSRRPVLLAKNLSFIATLNPMDRSARALDAAIVRRLHLISCPPDSKILREMLQRNGLSASLIDQVRNIFLRCEQEFPDHYSEEMPFGHGVFAHVTSETDLEDLWHGQIVHLLRRPGLDPHPFTPVIEEAYLWRSYR